MARCIGQRRDPVDRPIDELHLDGRIRSSAQGPAPGSEWTNVGLGQVAQVEVGHGGRRVETYGYEVLGGGLGQQSDHCPLQGSRWIAKYRRHLHLELAFRAVDDDDPRFLPQGPAESADTAEDGRRSLGRHAWLWEDPTPDVRS